MVKSLRLVMGALCVGACVWVVSSCASASAASAGSAAKADPWFRKGGPQAEKTIFSPLDLPTPSQTRLASGAPGPDYWQQRVDFKIQASLDPDERSVHGVETVTYHNNSPDTLDYLWLNLEQNLFRKDSIGARMTRPNGRFGNRDGFEGGDEIDYVRTLDHEALHLAVYDTVGRLDLPHPLGPGESFSFEVSWSFKIPPYGSDRLGMEDADQGTVFEIAQWFPSVCVYDDVHGWNTLPYLGAGEFYTNFGDYDVELTAPRDHIVVATGVLENAYDVLTAEQVQRLDQARHSEETVVIRGPDEVDDPATRPPGEGPLTWHFVAQNVRTFAWASSKAFIWDAAFLDSTGPVGPDGTPGGTLVQSVYPKEARPLWEKSTQMLRFSIDHYSKRWFPFPYPVAINVSGRVGGMEYPMIIFCRGRSSERGLYGVTTHEIGHNWFPMVVNTDERRHVWMDEGFNTFVNHYSVQDYFGKDQGNRTGSRYAVGRLTRPNQQPIVTEPDRMYGRSLGFLGYRKPGSGLRLLREQILGPERFDAAFRAYIRRWAFKSPRPADFFRTIEDAAGMDLAWFWRGWFLETGALDQAVETVTQPEQSDSALVTFQNKDALVMPVDYRVTFDDGQSVDLRLPVQVWASTNRWTTRVKAEGRRIVKVEIDPDGNFPDVDRANNVWVGD